MQPKLGSKENKAGFMIILVMILLYFLGGAVMGENFIGFAILATFIFPIIFVFYLVMAVYKFRRFDRLDKILFSSIVLIAIWVAYEVGVFCRLNFCPGPTTEAEIQASIYKENSWLDPSSPDYLRGPNGN